MAEKRKRPNRRRAVRTVTGRILTEHINSDGEVTLDTEGHRRVGAVTRAREAYLSGGQYKIKPRKGKKKKRRTIAEGSGPHYP